MLGHVYLKKEESCILNLVLDAKLNESRGFTLLEVLMASALGAMLLISIYTSIMAITQMNHLSMQYTQAMETLQGRAEELKSVPFDNIANSQATIPFDAGEDKVFDTADDIDGLLTIRVQDYLDMDNDGNTNETTIDVNGDGTNDCIDTGVCATPYTKPVRLTLAWTTNRFGTNKNYSIRIDTLVAR